MEDLLLKIKESLFESEKDNKIVNYIIVNNMDFIEHIEPMFKYNIVNETTPTSFTNAPIMIYGIPILRSVHIKRGEFAKCHDENPYDSYHKFTNHKLTGFKINKD